ncbi:hypothetical protein [Lamprocystis purpurea]|jgi:hypothetical protein|uniref:hypothetical protein n=1 Tax=Lamprocystis purpurea TaxID=61598 RepID=UPI0012F8CAB3|nr:hypothetical protein [Lamprocystis purpurea]MBV5347755.1 hypothetical protein [bacterium]
MITSPLLEAKYRIQKQLGEEAGHDILKYASNSHRIVSEIEAKYRVKFRYGSAVTSESQNPALVHESQEIA